MRRIITNAVIRDLERKIVFIVGPRQVGKTWLAKEIMKGYPGALYLNYDDVKHRAIMRDQAWLPDTPLVVFDEIHKMKGWKNYLKGVYDTRPEGMRILVTGSARLDAHRHIGDSLAGRYFTHRLMPFTLAEFEGTAHAGDLSRLLERGGFPEPFLANHPIDALRWRSLYGDAILRQEVLDFATVGDMVALRQVFDLLRDRVGSPVSASAIARDVGVSPITVRRYIGILEALYLIFVVRPYTQKIARAILKEPKIYFFDHAMVEHPAARLENMVAVGLLSEFFAQHDTFGEEKRLAFLKTKEGKEVDFAIVGSKQALERILEVKTSDGEVSPTLRYFSEKYHVPGVQLVKDLRIERTSGPLIQVRSAAKFLAKPE